MEQQNPWTPAAPPRSSSTGLIVGLAVGGAMLLLLIVAAGGIFAYSLLKSQQNSAPQGDPDEIVLRQEPGSGPALRYGTTPVYDACSLVTIDGLSRLDVSLSRDYFVAHEHLDADVPVSAAITADTPDPISNCFYMFGSDDSLHVRVHQTPFNSPDALTNMQERATRQGPPRTEADMSSVAWHDDKYESQHLMIWRPDLVVDISLRSEDSDGTLDPASFMPRLESLVRSGLSAPPTAPIRHTYLAPFDKVKDPCAVASAEAYKAAFPSAPGAPSMVDGSYTLDAPIPDSKRRSGKSREAQLSCTRKNIVPRGTLNEEHRALQVDLSVWTSSKAADLSNDANCAPSYKSNDHDEPVAVTPTIGTRKSCLADYESDWLLKFQLGAVNVTVANGDTDGKPDVSVRRDELVPAARAIAAAGLTR